MRQAGRVAAAIEVLEDIKTRHRPASSALKEWGNAHRFAGSGDRAVIGNLVFDCLRQRACLAARMDADTPRAIMIGVLRWNWGLEVDDITSIFSGDVHAPAPLDENELSALKSDTIANSPDWVQGDIPEWLFPTFSRVFGDQAVSEGAAMAQRAPVDLRVNSLKQSREKVSKALERFNPEQTQVSPSGIRIPAGTGTARAPAVQADGAFGKGWFEVQDEGSQIAALLTGAKPGMQVADICAGAGGKSLALSAMMENKGQIHAYDADRHRLKNIWDRLRRAGTRNIQVIEPGENVLTPLENHMDIVLIDAPCSGTGTWRRKPDSKWRLTEKTLEMRMQDQIKVLDMAAPLVKPGGRVVYVTCSVLPQENSDQIAAFLKRHGDFTPESLDQDIRQAIYNRRNQPMPDFESEIQLTPLKDSTDGFFIASLTRKSN